MHSVEVLWGSNNDAQGFRCVFGLGGKSDAWNSRIPYTRQIKREKAWSQEIPGVKPEMLGGKFTPFTP